MEAKLREGAVLEVQGANGRFYVDGDKLIISRKGAGLLTALNLGLQGEKAIPLSQITAVELKKPGFARGYLRLSINGRDPVGGLTEAVRDENALLLDKKSFGAAERMRDYLLGQIGRSPNTQQPASAADELEKFAQLKERGIISDAEFQAKKRQLLGL